MVSGLCRAASDVTHVHTRKRQHEIAGQKQVHERYHLAPFWRARVAASGFVGLASQAVQDGDGRVLVECRTASGGSTR